MQHNLARKGQLTVFIILGIVILLFFGMLFFLQGNLSFTPPPYQFNSPQSVHDVYTLCAGSVLSDALTIVGQQGGYAAPPSSLLDPDGGLVTWYTDRPVVRSLEQVERDLATVVVERFPQTCADIPRIAFKQGITITPGGTPEARVTLGTSDVTLVLNYPYTATQATVQVESKPILAKIQVPWSSLYRYAQTMVDGYAATGSILADIGCSEGSVHYYSGTTSLLVNITTTSRDTHEPYSLWLALQHRSP